MKKIEVGTEFTIQHKKFIRYLNWDYHKGVEYLAFGKRSALGYRYCIWHDNKEYRGYGFESASMVEWAARQRIEVLIK